MYKIFLCLRYLRSKVIAYFAMMGVALCVAMMVIVISVMTGFLDKIELAAKGLFGDIVVDTRSLGGLGYYDEFIAEVTEKIPEVEAGTPFILSVGILQFGSDHSQTVQVAGIRLPERAKVTDFEQGLFVQAGSAAPSFDPPVEAMIQTVIADADYINSLLSERMSLDQQVLNPPGSEDEVRRMISAINWHSESISILSEAKDYQDQLAKLQSQIDQATENLYSSGGGTFDEKEQRLLELEDKLTGPTGLEKKAGFSGPASRIILGLGLGAYSYRTDDGHTLRSVLPGHQLVLTAVPLGGRGGQDPMNISLVSRRFTVVDDVRTDVSSIDSDFVYVPFDTLQAMSNMDPVYSVDDPPRQISPARCNQIQFKVREDYANGAKLDEITAKIKSLWLNFNLRHPQIGGSNVTVLTWRQRQAHIISNVDRQRTLVILMFGIISMVSVVLIFVIFYMIVFQKTKDIGILKAIGASSGGIAQIFLAWGSAVGLVGAAIGTLGGWAFVHNINPIQDWLADAFGFRVWSKEYFIFEMIPNEVDWSATAYIIAGAILAGLIGALLPAIRAARMQPVEALRYE